MGAVVAVTVMHLLLLVLHVRYITDGLWFDVVEESVIL